MKRRAARLVDQVDNDFLIGAAVKARLDALEVRRAGLEPTSPPRRLRTASSYTQWRPSAFGGLWSN